MRAPLRVLAASLLSCSMLAGGADAQTYWGQGTAAATTGDCDPAIARHQDQLTRSAIDAATLLAAGSYNSMPSGGFYGMSCLDRLLSNGLNSIFEPPNLDSILAGIVNGICSFASNEVQSVTGNMLSGGNYSSLPIGQIIPGVNLGSLNGGLQVQPTTGASGGFISVNGGSPVSGNLAGYWGGQPYAVPGYGSLLTGGSTGGAASSSGWFSSLLGN